MNVQIKKLEPQCWEHNEFGLNFNYQKFADLIVKECMRQVEVHYKPVLYSLPFKEPYWDGYAQCGVDSYVAIREHFYGVEE